jgi:hypothetical protein
VARGSGGEKWERLGVWGGGGYMRARESLGEESGGVGAAKPGKIQ